VSFPRLQRIHYRFKWVKEGASLRNSRLEDSSGRIRVSFCRLQSLAQEESRIVYRVHQSRSCGGARFDSDPPKRSPRRQEAKPLHECGDWVECGKNCGRGYDGDSRIGRERPAALGQLAVDELLNASVIQLLSVAHALGSRGEPPDCQIS
jgi:hypothetical protein